MGEGKWVSQFDHKPTTPSPTTSGNIVIKLKANNSWCFSVNNFYIWFGSGLLETRMYTYLKTWDIKCEGLFR